MKQDSVSGVKVKLDTSYTMLFRPLNSDPLAARYRYPGQAWVVRSCLFGTKEPTLSGPSQWPSSRTSVPSPC